MDKTIKLILITCLLTITTQTLKTTYAHPGRTAGDGCHYCRTNCSKWGEVENARHCHGGGSSSGSTGGTSAPLYAPVINTTPIPTVTPVPTATPTPLPTPTKPLCPNNSIYNYINDQCECKQNYKKVENQCEKIKPSPTPQPTLNLQNIPTESNTDDSNDFANGVLSTLVVGGLGAYAYKKRKGN